MSRTHTYLHITYACYMHLKRVHSNMIRKGKRALHCLIYISWNFRYLKYDNENICSVAHCAFLLFLGTVIISQVAKRSK